MIEEFVIDFGKPYGQIQEVKISGGLKDGEKVFETMNRLRVNFEVARIEISSFKRIDDWQILIIQAQCNYKTQVLRIIASTLESETYIP